jgi:hypothetical protein
LDRKLWLPAVLMALALAAAPVPAGEAKPAEDAETAKKIQQLTDELVTPPAAEPGAEAAKEIAALIDKLGSSDFETRDTASKTILKHKAAALGALRRALESKDPEVVERAKQAITEIGSGARAEVLAKVKALGEAGKKEAARRLAGAAAELVALSEEKKPEDEKAREADLAARRTKAEAVWKRAGALAEMQAAAWGLFDDAPDIGSRPVRLMNVLRDQDAGKRAAAVWALGAMETGQPGTAVGFLGRALHDQDVKVRLAMVWAMGLSGQASGQTGQVYLQILGQNADADMGKAISAVKELPRQ